MATFRIEIKNLDSTLKAFDRYGERAEEAVWRGIQRTAFDVKDYAVTTVHKVTTTLARSIQITDENRQNLSTAVSTNVEYARIEEEGFNGIMGVSAHNRTMTQAFGKPFVKTVSVSSHIRHVVREPHPYMEPAAQFGQRRIGQNVRAELRALTL